MYKSFYYLVGILIFFSLNIFPQVTIKEKVNINPENITTQSSNDSFNIKLPIYLRHGGSVTIYMGIDQVGEYELWEESLGHLEGGSLPFVDSLNLGTFPQWHKFVFYLYDPSTGKRYYNESPDLEDPIDGGFAPLELGFWPTYPPDSISSIPEANWAMNLQENLSLARMPPQEVLDLYFIPGNPFTPDNSIYTPVNGNAYAVVKSANNASVDNLFTDIPKDSLLAANVKNYVGDTLRIGKIIAGDSIRFYIKSSNTIVNGMKLYPANFYEEPFQTGDGEMYLGTLNFEDWTDLYFDDLQLDVYVHPDSINTYYSDVAVNFNHSEISPGDTAQITLMQRNADGTLSPFNTGTTFDVSVFQGQQDGTLYSPQYSDTSDSFTGTNGNISFIAADSVKNDSAQAVIKVIAHPSGGGISSSVSPVLTLNKKKTTGRTLPSNTKTVIQPGNASLPMNKITGSNNLKKVTIKNPGFIGFGVITIKEQTILLGQSKYYQAEQNTKTGELRIEEIKPDKSGIPKQKTGTDGDWQWITNNSIWGNNPVKWVSGDKDKSKIGVYWEIGKPIWIKGQDKEVLSNGLIRIVGKYWSTGNTYKAKLIAKNSDSQSSILLRVNRPTALLSPSTSHSYMSVLDIYNKPINMDALLIEYAGKYGIPPQLLKGQMYQEAQKENFAFWPSYRYEPWKDLSFRIGKHSTYYLAQPYWVDQTGMGAKDGGEPVPTTHQNVKPILSFSSTNAYPNTPLKIGDYVADNLNQYYADKGGLSRKFSGFPFYGPASLQMTWALLTSYYSSYGKADALYISDSLIKTYLRQTYTSFAQTRKAASYGFFQMLYTTAIETKIGYPRRPGNTPAPENLNDENVEFPYVMNTLINDVKAVLKHNKNDFNDGNWKNGLEQTWLDSYVKYNDGPGYNTKVFENSYLFLPSGEGEQQ